MSEQSHVRMQDGALRAGSLVRSLGTLLTYSIVVLIIAAGWSLRDQRLLHAETGVGYWLGIAGTTLMVLLLSYPLKKRVARLKFLGPTRHWFRVHMIFGIAGPVLVLFHSNFTLGSTNSKVALFSTLIVAFSGVVGRYLYAKIHRGLSGQRETFDSLRTQVESLRSPSSSASSLVPVMNEHLNPIENKIAASRDGVLAALATALVTTVRCPNLRRTVKRAVREEVVKLSTTSRVVAENRSRLVRSTTRYVDFRISVLRRFAQLRAFERLFSLWHIVHYPLFMVLVFAATIHIVAVHMY